MDAPEVQIEEYYVEAPVVELTEEQKSRFVDAGMAKYVETIAGKSEVTEEGKIVTTMLPYRAMLPKELNVFSICCPTKVAVEEYSHEVIPTRILDHIELCKKHGWFKRMEIWYDDASPDPLLVGVRLENGWRDIRYLIARWSTELVPYVEMEAEARKRWIAQKRLALVQAKAQAENVLNALDVYADAFVNGNRDPYHIHTTGSI